MIVKFFIVFFNSKCNKTIAPIVKTQFVSFLLLTDLISFRKYENGGERESKKKKKKERKRKIEIEKKNMKNDG